jgi:hypothetical protein
VSPRSYFASSNPNALIHSPIGVRPATSERVCTSSSIEEVPGYLASTDDRDSPVARK